ncbi:MAG: DUF2249 domain-containing protein [Burkholderiaceae bacterium]|nr:DUF2249 domain-containing protein [Rhodoferax sp.]MCP5284024.1 DUF2249 domain-containing protein [Burkholderiaceae bacterium]
MTGTPIPPTFELDLRTIPPRERHPLIFGRFDALITGQALQLVNDHNPQPLRYQFDDRASGQFEWAALEAGPDVWRIQITRIADATAPAAGTEGDTCCSGGACCG